MKLLICTVLLLCILGALIATVKLLFAAVGLVLAILAMGMLLSIAIKRFQA